MEEEGQERTPPTLEDGLKLLKGERDEQRLAGLLLVTKFCKGDDLHSLRRVYDAVGSHFLDRLLRTGVGKGNTSGGGGAAENRDAYLQLSVTVLAAFCRVPEIASSKEMVSKVPLVLEAMSSSSTPVVDDFYEFLYLVTDSSERGALAFYESGGMSVVASQICALPDGSHTMELAIKVVQFVLSKLSMDFLSRSNLADLATMVAAIARQFAVSHSALKFEALHLLSYVFTLRFPESFYESLRAMGSNNWPDYMRHGIVAILQNRVAHPDKLCALILAESTVSILGENWLIAQSKLPGHEESLPADRCLMLVLETSRVEIAVLLNELAYLKHEASESTSTTAENFMLKQRDVGIAFSLIESIIKLISEEAGNEGEVIGESTLIKVIHGLNETTNVVLDYLQDAKEHGRKKGNDLLASVRVIGSYLAETPDASKERVRELLDYMLLVEGEEEPSPFSSICFMLPLLCQITRNISGCRSLVSTGVHKAVAGCLIKLVMQSGSTSVDRGSISFACETIVNLLSKIDRVQFTIEDPSFINLLTALGCWADNADDPSIIVMASSICSLIFGHTSEEALLDCPDFDARSIYRLSQAIARSMTFYAQGMPNMVEADVDLPYLLEVIVSGLLENFEDLTHSSTGYTGYSLWADRFPSTRDLVERS